MVGDSDMCRVVLCIFKETVRKADLMVLLYPRDIGADHILFLFHEDNMYPEQKSYYPNVDEAYETPLGEQIDSGTEEYDAENNDDFPPDDFAWDDE